MLVLLIDDHPLYRQALMQVINDSFPLWKTQEASTGAQALDIVRREPVSLAVLDIMLPDQSGLDLLKRIKQLRPNLPCLMLSMHNEPRYAELSFHFGASGYLTKDTERDELCRSLRTILAGGRHVAASLTDRLETRGAMSRTAPSASLLSARELEVLTHFGQGLTVSQAATRMKLSIKTVSTYRARLLEKLQLKTTAALIRYAVDHHLAP
ncbi:MAG: response regulator transcription factor [Nitrospirae bacterium]|jgi:two-component system invasion response regulator UvrY|nr:response regulator transcription factor [Nitrospirota bacterium]